MAAFEDFRPGDRVAHISCGDGVVSAVEDGLVKVTYDRRNERGKNWIGAYDPVWFEHYPRYLFHRSERADR